MFQFAGRKPPNTAEPEVSSETVQQAAAHEVLTSAARDLVAL